MYTHLYIFLAFAVLLGATTTISAKEPTLNDKPVAEAFLHAVHKRFREGDAEALNDLADTNSKKAASDLMEYIVPQSEVGDRDATAAGRALARMHAERHIHELIQKYVKRRGQLADRDRYLAFFTLSFMQSRAAVRTLASFLDDTAINPTDIYPLGGTNADYAAIVLSKMELLHAPFKFRDSISLTDQADEKWREWWKSNAASFQGDGPLPTE